MILADLLKTNVLRLNFFLAAGVLLFISSQASAQEIYRDVNQPVEDRAKDLVSRMTLEEKIGQMMNGAPAIPRLGVKPYNWWNEALHGVGRSGVATVFPQAIAMGATFDSSLIYDVATAISDEARAMYQLAVDKGYYQKYGGLTFWTPNVNIFRDPRWGRGQETYGEDPFLTSSLGIAFVKGLQGDDPDYLKTAACAKHFAVHSGPEKLRHEFDAVASKKDMYETYLPAFEALVKEDVEAVMCAYNATNGEPCCADNYLLQEVLREEWGFDGHVVSDCGAVADFYQGHNVVETEAEAAAMAVNSGVNLNCGSSYTALQEAVDQGLVSEERIDEVLVDLYKTRFKLGMFDPDEGNPYANISADVINSDEHRQLAREVARKSVVMLKNNGVLPLRNDLSSYFVTGPNAADLMALIGNYYGINPEMVTIQEGIAGAIAPGSQLQFRTGTLLNRPNANPIDWASGNAKTTDATFYVMGINGLIEGEEGAAIASEDFGDRLEYDLPENQIEYLEKLTRDNDKPVIAIVTGGSPMNLDPVYEMADAVLLVWYPGEEGGNAVSDILFGKASPSGRLPITFPKSFDQLPPYEDYNMEGRTYRYMTEQPMFPFGFGLSYAEFDYTDLQLSKKEIRKGQNTKVSVNLINKGDMEAEEVVQLYIKDKEADVRVPLHALKSVKRVSLGPGETKEVSFTITPEMLELVNEDGERELESGKFTVFVGGTSPGERSLELGASVPLKAELSVR